MEPRKAGSTSSSARRTGSKPPSSTSTSSSSSPRTQYLILYNLINAALWLAVLARVVFPLTLGGGYQDTYREVGGFTKWTQTLATLEIVHAATGVVRSPIFTTFIQVYSRLYMVWGVVDMFPQVAQSPAYSSMLVAYGCTEVIRYSYFAFSLSGHLPKLVNWLRYSTFIALYPLGISSEYWLIWLSFGPAKGFSREYGWFTLFHLLVWPPSAYILITHMLAQRRKVLKGR